MNDYLSAGAGRAPIEYTREMLPNFHENFTDIHDLPMVQVLMLGAEDIYAVVVVNAVILTIRETLLDTAAEALGIPRENILLHATHDLSAPHFHFWEDPKTWRLAAGHRNVPEEEALSFAERENRMAYAHIDAVRRACAKARETYGPVRFGAAEAYAPVNVNRVVETGDGWWNGFNPDGPSDHSVPVLRFDREDGRLLALLFNCNTASGCMEFSTVSGGGRMISGDLAGASTAFLDKWYGGEAVSIYTTGFTGDQWQTLRARLDYMDSQGRQIVEDLQEEGFALVKSLGTRLGQQVCRSAEQIKTRRMSVPLQLSRFAFRYPAQQVISPVRMRPTRECRFIADGEETAELQIFQIGDTALVALGVEICHATAQAIKAASPFAHTVFLEFTVDGGGYMPEAIFYDRMTPQASKSRFARGTAEQFREDVIRCLQAVYTEY